MSMFDQELSKPSGMTTAVQPTKKANPLEGLAQGISAIGRGVAGMVPEKGDADSETYRRAAIQRQELEAETLADLDQAEEMNRRFPEIFADNQVTAEEEKILREAQFNVDRLRSITDPMRRRVKLNEYSRKFLNEFSPDVKPEVVDKVLSLYNIKVADSPIEDRYGSDLFKAVQSKYQDPAPIHYVIEAARNREIAQVQDLKRGQEAAIIRGQYGAPEVRKQYTGLIDQTMLTYVASLRDAWKVQGALTDDQMSWYGDELARAKQSVKANLAESLAFGAENGVLLDANELNKAVDEQFSVWEDLKTQFGTDPSMSKRVDTLFELWSKTPELAAGKPMRSLMEIARTSGLGLDVFIGILSGKQGNINEQMKKLGVPVLSDQDIALSVQYMTEAIKANLEMAPDKLPDPSYARLAQFLALKGSSKRPTDGTKVPEKWISTSIDAMESGDATPAHFFRYMYNSPGFAANVLDTPGQTERMVPLIRNNLASLKNELQNSSTTWHRYEIDKAGNIKAYTDRGLGRPTRPQDQWDVDVNLSTMLTNTYKFLASPNAQKILGGDAEYQDLQAFVKGTVRIDSGVGITPDELNNWSSISDSDLREQSAAELSDTLTKLDKTMFNTPPGRDSYKQMKELRTRIDSALKEASPEGKSQAPRLTKEEMLPLVKSAAEEHGVDSGLLAKLIGAESNWDQYAKNSTGAAGLGQLMPGTAKELGVSDPHDAEQGINGAAKYLAKLQKQFSGVGTSHLQPVVLAAYNWGPGNMRKALSAAKGDAKQALSTVPPETRAYLLKILGLDVTK